jgi:hypothetical protein
MLDGPSVFLRLVFDTSRGHVLNDFGHDHERWGLRYTSSFSRNFVDHGPRAFESEVV